MLFFGGLWVLITGPTIASHSCSYGATTKCATHGATLTVIGTNFGPSDAPLPTATVRIVISFLCCFCGVGYTGVSEGTGGDDLCERV